MNWGHMLKVKATRQQGEKKVSTISRNPVDILVLF